MKLLRTALILLPILALAACLTTATYNTMGAKRERDAKVSFDQFKTYAWAAQPASQKSASPAVDASIRAAAEQDLATKGLKKVGGGQTDLLLVYHITSEHGAAATQDYTDWGQPSRHYRGWTGRPETFSELEQDKGGTLVLDMVEVRRNQLVWRGVANAGLTGPGANDPARAKEAVNVLFSVFPPPNGPAPAAQTAPR